MTTPRFLMSLIVLVHGWAWADPQLATDALRHLIEKRGEAAQAAGSPVQGTDDARSGRRQEPLKPSETLDGLIRRTWPGLPSKEMWVRKTFVDLNTKAFVSGNPNLLQPGAVMTIPSQDDLRQAFASAQPHVAALFGPPRATPAPAIEPPGQAPARPQNSWVRFP